MFTVANPKKDSNRKRPGRRTTGKITVVVRMLPETKTRVEKAAREFNLDSTSEYVEKAILAQLKKDGIK
jgi:hypothetical protein